MANGSIPNGSISKQTLSKWILFIMPIVLSATVTWTISQTTARDHENRITKLEIAQKEAAANQMAELKAANIKLQELLEIKKQELEQKKGNKR